MGISMGKWQKSIKWPKITFWGPIWVPKVSFWGFWEWFWSIKVFSEFWFGHPKCHFWYPKNDQKGSFWSFWGYQKWHFGCPNQNSETTFIDQNHPQNPQKDTLGTQIGPRKVIFCHFACFWYFYLIFFEHSLSTGRIFQMARTLISLSQNAKLLYFL